MTSPAALLRSIHGRLFGTRAIQARFDVLQNKVDALEQAIDRIEGSIRNLAHVVGKSNAYSLLERHRPPDSGKQRVGHLPGVMRNAGIHAGPVVDRIGFLVQSLELVNHYGCVWDELPGDRFDVLLHGDTLAVGEAAFDRWRCNVVTTSELLQSNTKYRYLVSNHPVSVEQPPLVEQLAITNVRFMYAAGKSGWNLSEWNNLYDLIMCFGPYHATLLSNLTQAIVLQMGYPRFDRYFTTQPNPADLQSRYGCDPSKPTVVWLPTWKTLSSVGRFDHEIGALCDRYNVVVKLHPFMPASEPERVDVLKSFGFTRLIADASDNLPLYQLADFMLFDYGGPPLAGIYADKNMILLNVPGADTDDLTGSDSPDVSIRRYIANVDAEERGIATLLADPATWRKQISDRRMLRHLYFAPYFGFSSSIAANALLNLRHIVDESRESWRW